MLAHELGHFKRRHVLKRIASTFALSLGFLWLLAQLLHAQWFYQGLGVTSAIHRTRIAAVLHGAAGIHLSAAPHRFGLFAQA